jgi:hypothetical protein
VNSAAAEEIDTAPFEITINELWLLNIITIIIIILNDDDNTNNNMVKKIMPVMF